MTVNVYYYCDSNEINTLGTNIEHQLGLSDWTADTILSHLIAQLKKENKALSVSIQFARGGQGSKALQTEDAIVDKHFVCLKQFVSANMYLSDESIVENATAVWKIISSHNLNLHKLSYERQLALTHALISNLEDKKIKPWVDSMIGVSDRVAELKASTTSFETHFRNMKEELAGMEETIAPSTQKNTIRDLINNHLLPYLNNASQVMPEKYEEINKVIIEHIDGINTKARARKTRNTNQEPEPSATE
jgi:hypothetical protein